MSKGPEWFAPKTHGFGSGLPIAWQGWVILILFVAAITIAGILLAERSPLALFAITTFLVALLLIITAKTTKGGWKWRWGETDFKGNPKE